MRLVEAIIGYLVQRLTKDGSLILVEVYYNSFLIPSITSAIIFYGLKFFSHFDIYLSKIIKEFPPGLDIDFLYDKELVKFLDKY